MKRTRGQVLTVHFKNGKVGKFIGPAVIEKDDGDDAGTIGIDRIQFSPPLELRGGHYFAENRDGIVFLVREGDADDEGNPVDEGGAAEA